MVASKGEVNRFIFKRSVVQVLVSVTPVCLHLVSGRKVNELPNFATQLLKQWLRLRAAGNSSLKSQRLS